MEERLDEVASGERPWVPLLREFYGPLKTLVDEKRRELKRKDFTTEPTDEVCSEGHPMVIRLGRNGRFLACSLYPEHKESRPLPGEELPPVLGTGDPCPECNATDGGVLVTRSAAGSVRSPAARATPTASTSTRPVPSRPPSCRSPSRARSAGRATWRRGAPVARNSLFWGCSRYPACDFTTSREPVGAVHDTDDGPDRGKRPTARRSACAVAPRDAARGGLGRRREAGRWSGQSRGTRAAGSRGPAAVARSSGGRRAAGGGARPGPRRPRRTKRARSTPGGVTRRGSTAPRGARPVPDRARCA